MAQKFKYRLARVLGLRERKQNDLKRDRAASERERDRERDALDELKARLDAAKKAVGASLARGQSANVQMGNEYANALEQKIVDQEKKLKAAEDKVEGLGKTLILATRDVKILEKHREKHKETWQSDEARKETIALDEMAVQGYLKRVNRDQYEDAEEAERTQRLAAEAQAALEQSPWIAGLIDSAHHEAKRRSQSATVSLPIDPLPPNKT